MWSLGKVVKTPEVMRVYIGKEGLFLLFKLVTNDFHRAGSFWNEPYHITDNAKLFDAEQVSFTARLFGCADRLLPG